MKKSVILILIAVYVLSIGIVGTIGLNVRVYAPNVKPTSVEITQLTYLDTVLDCKINDKGLKFFKRITTQSDSLTFELRYIIGPDNATDKTVLYSVDPENQDIKVEDGRLIFTRPVLFDESGIEINDPIEVSALVTLILNGNNSVSDTVQITVSFK